MAFRKNLTQRLHQITKISSPTLNLTLAKSPSSAPSLQTLIPPNPSNTTFRRDFLTTSDSGEDGFFRRFLQKRAIFQSAMSPEFPSLIMGDKLMEKLKGMNMNKDRIRLDGLSPPLAKKSEPLEGISIEDAKKLLKVTQLEMLKSTLRRIPKNCVSYSEFVQICVEGSSSNQGLEFAKMLDESGSVIVLGNVVFLRPEQVTRAIEGIIPLSIAQPNDPRRNELEKMEKEKVVIDKKAEELVRRELWCGLGFFVLQTIGFMRLTFWELSWDVMEPICFGVGSIYFMAGYIFFLSTSKDPSFEGFFESRFRSKQIRLMKMKKFDIARFNELRKACYPYSSEPSSSPPSPFYNSERTLIGAMHN